MQTQTETVSAYTLMTATGRRIRKATRVTFGDGYKVSFTERMPRYLAIPQAIEIRKRDEAREAIR